MAEQAGMSSRHFARAFIAETGTTASKAAERLPIEVARQRLQFSREAIEQSHGRGARAAFRSITTETLAKMVDQREGHYKCSGCNPGKCLDTRRMVFASRTGSRDIAHDRYSCIAV
jgi:AraC-like DNA-binding protein